MVIPFLANQDLTPMLFIALHTPCSFTILLRFPSLLRFLMVFEKNRCYEFTVFAEQSFDFMNIGKESHRPSS